jgi:hypothetical protein
MSLSSAAGRLLSTAVAGADRRRVTTTKNGVKTVTEKTWRWNPSAVKSQKRGLIDWSQETANIHLCLACSDTIKTLKVTAKPHGTLKQDVVYSGRPMCSGCKFATAQFIVTYTKKKSQAVDEDDAQAQSDPPVAAAASKSKKKKRSRDAPVEQPQSAAAQSQEGAAAASDDERPAKKKAAAAGDERPAKKKAAAASSV